VADARAFYEQQIAEGALGSVQTIQGVPALVIPPDAQAKGLPGSVDVVIRGVHVTIIGYGGFSETDLVGLASSLA
jgi:hypothetical protein